MKTVSTFLVTVLASFLLSSCGDDPELVKKHGEQESEIAKLNGELSLLNARLKNLPPDDSAKLEKSMAEAAKLEDERTRLSNEVAILEAEHNELLEKYEDYKIKYSIR